MAKKSNDSLESFLLQQDVQTLAAILLELAAEHDPVLKRLGRLQVATQPAKLAAAFKRTLASWRRSSRYYHYREVREFARQLHLWLEQVERELLPRDPPAAIELFEQFIQSDDVWFNHADDSGGDIGDVMRCACRLWLTGASRCEAPVEAWPQRLLELALKNDYGAREELLRQANLLLPEPQLRQLADLLQGRLESIVAASGKQKHPPFDVFRLSGSISNLSEAIGDPDVQVRAVCAYSPHPNPLQVQDFVRAYLDVGRPEDAMPWLVGHWGPQEQIRLSLLAEAHGAQGQTGESASIRQGLFEKSLAVHDLERWLEQLPAEQHEAARNRAHQLALSGPDVIVTANLLLALDDPAGAETRLLAGAEQIDGRFYGSLVPLVKALRELGCARAETAVLRSLLKDVLARANSQAYGHAARYWARLGEIAQTGVDLSPLPGHAMFEAEVRLRHGRKPAFWARVNGKHLANVGEDEGLED